ncbi:heterokaryon incompatibility [Nemania sp. FL0916]|nr:heterokaryon incompatibility [Nemania sp. FL0916]
MRLLNTRTFKLEHYHSHAEVDYAILSHTWQKDEVLFADIEAGSEHWSKIEGASKVKRAAATAAKHGFKYIWIDTCCIDKDSSAELSEAINSMFKWYQHSVICYAYLCDVKLNSEAPTSVDAEFEKSRWFTRAWTGQSPTLRRFIYFFCAQSF